MNFSNIIISILVLLALGFIYNKIKSNIDDKEKKDDLDLIKRYLLQNRDDLEIANLGNMNKPILWIHIDYDYNARHWSSFGGRSSYDLNMPFIYLTIQSIIYNCGDSFHVCIIDDSSFKKLLPSFDYNLAKIADPVRRKFRTLGLLKLLHKYGGLHLENSFICFNNLDSLYSLVLENNTPIVGEFMNKSNVNLTFMPCLKFYGCVRECDVTYKLCVYMEELIKSDYTECSVFEGSIQKQLLYLVQNKALILIDGEIIGTKHKNKEIDLEFLLTNDKFKLSNKAQMLYIPTDCILNRPKYSWFIRMSPKQILESNTNLGNIFLK